jgi:hypothetical protein
MIDFTRACSTAWERTRIILFEPWDPVKWFVIGFNSFLALLAEGGVAINNSIPFQSQSQNYDRTYPSLPAFLHALKQSFSWVSSLAASPWFWAIVAFALFYLVAWLVLNWVGCRGQFMFLDNIVRNRAAIVVPWQRYARQGNTWFLVQLALSLLTILLFAAGTAVFLALSWTWITAERNPAGAELVSLGIFVVGFMVLWIIYASVTYLIRSFVIPTYFRQTMSLGAAFATVGRLVISQFLSILAYLLVSFVLAFAAGILALLFLLATCCLICWLSCIPCLGSMALSFALCQIILPITIFFRCFQLDCLAQFGPECDVWTVDVPPVSPPQQPG